MPRGIKAVEEVAPKAKKLSSDLGKVTARLKDLCAKHQEARETASKSAAELFVLTYQWVTITVADHPEKLQPVIQRLAAMLGLREANATYWFYCGRTMREEGIDFRTANAHAVRVLYQYRGMLSDAEYRKAVAEVRAGKASGAVRKIAKKSTHVLELQAQNKAKKLEKEGKLTPTRVKMELLAAMTLAKRLYGHEVVVSIFDLEDKELLTVR